MVEIKEITEKEIEIIMPLYLEYAEKICAWDPGTYEPVTAQNEQVWQDELANDMRGNRYFVAQKGNDVVGYIGLHIQKLPKGMTKGVSLGYIIDIIVGEKYRRQGIGRELVQFAEGFFKEQGTDTVQLKVMATNPEAQALYKKLGYETFYLGQRKSLK